MEKTVKKLWKWEADGEFYGPCIILAEDGEYYIGHSTPEGFKNLKLVEQGNVEVVEKLTNDANTLVKIKLQQEVIILVSEENWNLGDLSEQELMKPLEQEEAAIAESVAK